MVKPIPENYHSITPYLYVTGASRAIDFYKRAFGATEMVRMDGPNGTISHAELRIGDSVIMLADENVERKVRSPQTTGATPVGLLLYVEKVDQVYERAVKEGAKPLDAVRDQFYGDRMGSVTDPFGHQWFIATHTEDVTPEEMKRRMARAMGA